MKIAFAWLALAVGLALIALALSGRRRTRVKDLYPKGKRW